MKEIAIDDYLAFMDTENLLLSALNDSIRAMNEIVNDPKSSSSQKTRAANTLLRCQRQLKKLEDQTAE